MACRHPIRNQKDNHRHHRRKQNRSAFTYNDSSEGTEVSSPEWEFIDMTEQEEDMIHRMYALVGDRWSLIAGRVPGRKPEEIERFWIMKNADWFACRRTKRQKSGKYYQN